MAQQRILEMLQCGSKVAVVTMTGTCCPVTLAHIQAFVESRQLLLSRGFHAVLGGLSLNADGYVSKKLREKGLPSISLADRAQLVEMAIQDYDWLAYNNSSFKNEDAYCKFYQERWPHLHFEHYYLNGADDVIRRKKWNWRGVRQIVMCRPGITDDLMSQLHKAGIDTTSDYFIVGPELPDISSTEVRHALTQGDQDRLLQLVHPDVAHWCWKKGPYRPQKGAAWEENCSETTVAVESKLVSGEVISLDGIHALCNIGTAGETAERQKKAVASSGGKGARALIARETLDILAMGNYMAPDSLEPVDISDSLCQAVAASTHVPAATRLEPLTVANKQKINIEVRCCTTLAAAQDLACSQQTSSVPGVLNFASARNPGGGFTTGAEAQEESLARSSGIYPCLSKHFDTFFAPNRRAASGLYTHDLIYSPAVPVLRNEHGILLPQPYAADFVTAAAPNFGVLENRCGAKEAAEQCRNAYSERIHRVLHCFASHGCVDIVLGAWGCGVFRNNPAVVAHLFNDHLAKFNCFRRVIFAVLDPQMASSFAAEFDVELLQCGEKKWDPKGKGASKRGKGNTKDAQQNATDNFESSEIVCSEKRRSGKGKDAQQNATGYVESSATVSSKGGKRRWGKKNQS